MLHLRPVKFEPNIIRSRWIIFITQTIEHITKGKMIVFLFANRKLFLFLKLLFLHIECQHSRKTLRFEPQKLRFPSPSQYNTCTLKKRSVAGRHS